MSARGMHPMVAYPPNAVAAVPGIFSIREQPGGLLSKIPLRHGPICERCWLAKGDVNPVMRWGCPHEAEVRS